MLYLSVFCWTLVVVTVLVLRKGFVFVLWRPFAVKRRFERQGVTGPPYRLVTGCHEEVRRLKESALQTILDYRCHDLTGRINPHHQKWSSTYGATVLFWNGIEPWLLITDAEMVKQILSNKFGFFTKATVRPAIRSLLGGGLVFTEGSDWVRHRRVLNPAFSTDKLKAMTKIMAACTLSMIDGWKDVEIEMRGVFKQLAADIISHTAFGNSYAQGKEVFEALTELQTMAAATALNIHIPGYRYLPNAFNNKRRSLEKKVRQGLRTIISSRTLKSTGGYGHDLLGLMLDACAAQSTQKGALTLTMDEIIDECKTFYFAGHETIASLLTWTIFLISTNKEWQDKLRNEVLTECGGEIPNADMVSKLKYMNMFLVETLRLYGPVAMMTRMADVDVQVGNLMIPRGTTVSLPLILLHRNKDVWGSDANEFNPLRFEDGISKASKHPNGLLPFSLGPRTCIGQNFALMQAKLVIAMILQRYAVSLSPEYKHAPIDLLTVQPQFGLPTLVRSLNV